MPLYDFECLKCNKIKEIFVLSHKDKNRVKCDKCGDKMNSLITINSKPISFDYFCPMTNEHFTGPADRERKLKSKGYAIL